MSLTSDDLADLKQLMEATVSVILKEQEKRFDAIDARFNAVEARFDEQDEKLNTIMDAVGVEFGEHVEQLEDHESRIIRLEKRTA
jgi:hypothetical protein